MTFVSRRTLLKSAAVLSAYGAGLAVMPRLSQALAATDPVEIEALTGDVLLDGKQATRGVMRYALSGQTSTDPSPPILRARRGEAFKARLINRLDEPTTIHWHGIRLPNDQDGVPFVTQPHVYTGDRFDYAFSPPDAGTFWYHPHCNTLTQMGRGLAGVLVVEDERDPVFDGEVVLNLRDFRLGGDSQFIEQFKPREAAKTGTFGTLRTANWRPEPHYDVPAGGLVRVRILAADVTRIYNLKLAGAEAQIIAIDGHPLLERIPLDMAVVSPGQRLDLAVRVADSEGVEMVLEDIRPSTPKVVARFRAVGASLKRNLGDLGSLAENAGVEADLSNATEIPLLLSATAETAARDSICGTLGYSFWAINKVPYPGDTPDPTAPIAELKLGRTYLLNVENVTPHAHPIHLHGMNFKAISSNKREVQPLVSDTYLVLPDEKVQLALVADNPGDWVFHCHIIEHQKTGMTGYFRVT
ncbi:multicopper oxidase family protein [Rhizobium rosettiformans]|uniref:Multicopper oxidase family protein n=1 Tax=Rhizobium rosettiformans TaxID=1368430 RepID=A0ABX7EYS6_9HYPH|nr:multicopper oxidase family protein [Rhizobium rosettiformans]QRF52592.1 multicopper oxidase family protein [Rhizobium rosettiformans]